MSLPIGHNGFDNLHWRRRVSVGEGSPPAPRPVRRRVRAAQGIGLALVLLLALATVLWLARRPLAREAVTWWLERRGVAAEVTIDRLELDGMVGAVVLGDPQDPHVTAPRVEVDWTVGAPWRAGGLGVTPTRIRLVDAQVKARWTGRRLSFGTLDPLIDEFARRPARTDQVGPVILLENATLRLDSDWGRTTLLGDARVADGQLASLQAVLPAADYRNGDLFARGVGGRLELGTLNGRTGFSLALEGKEARLPGVDGAGLKLAARGSVSYPDVGGRSADGPVRLNADVSVDRLASGGWSARGLNGTIAYAGQAQGGGGDLKLDGRATLDLRAAALSGPLDAASPHLIAAGSEASLAFPAGGPAWRLDGPLRFAAARAELDGHRLTGLDLSSADLILGGRGDAVEATGPVALTATSLTSGPLTLEGVTARARMDAVLDGPARLRLTGAVAARGGRWPLLGAASRDDVPELATLKRALADFSLSAPGVDLRLQADGATATLTKAAVVRPRSGGTITVRPASGALLRAAPGGAPGGDFDVTLTGGGLPEARLRFADWRLTSGGFRSGVSGRAALDFGIGRGVVLDGAGRLETTSSGVTFTTTRCTPLSVDRLELGENDVSEVSGALCPVGRPLFAVTGGGWRVDGRFQDVAARAPFLALRVADAEGPLAVRGTPGGLVLNAGIDGARVLDATDPVRFLPLTATGHASLSGDRWTGAFDVAREGTPVGSLTLTHDGISGVGGVDVVSRDLVFAEGGLQPSDLTPLGADVVRAPVAGRARFDGRVDWNPTGGTSGGLLTLDGLNFDSPAGPVEGLSGAITLTSLAPLETAPDQAVTIDRVVALTDGTDVRVTFDLDKSALNVDAASVSLAGGSATLEPLSLPLEPGRPFSGVLALDRIQLGDLISATGLHDKLSVDAVISGRLPFTWTPGKGATIQGGGVYSVQPGRLSLRREALDGLETAGGGGDVPPNVVQDMAYQAMENLAFEELTASLDSLDGGRLAARFHVLGRHDPPERQELRLTWIELFRRDFLGRELPLPSDTGIDLTLDVNLNINQLISDLIALNAARNGGGNRD